MMQLYDTTCFSCSKIITRKYSTSFSLGIIAFDKELRQSIYAVYGFVRLADEIVDTFHDYDKGALISRLRQDTFCAIEEGISINPVLHAFQSVVNLYGIDHELIRSFLCSMEMDLRARTYEDDCYQKYIYGSAEVIGLMCLKIFCRENQSLYQQLSIQACRLGAAFQKVNFLRDLRSDFEERGRVYFPGIDFTTFSDDDKREIESDIQGDFDEGLKGLVQLPPKAKKGVLIAYYYYMDLFRKIRSVPASRLMKGRMRVSNPRKAWLAFKTLFLYKLKGV